MLKSSFHTHSHFDDGTCDLEDYVLSALEKDFGVLGFSAHAPVLFDSDWHMKQDDLDEYVGQAESLREKYRDRIEIYIGLEADYYKGCVDWRNKKGIDYTIGAIHVAQDPKSGKYHSFDGTRKDFDDILENIYDRDIRLLVAGYYGLVREMIMKMTPNIVAHLDVIRKNNQGGRYFDETEEWYRDEVLSTLEVVSLSQAILEINTGGIARGYTKEPYPSRWILEYCLDMDIPVMVNSDSHHPDNIDCCFDEVYEMLKGVGFKSQRILYRGEWKDVGL